MSFKSSIFKSQREGQHLVIDNYIFTKAKENNNGTVRWYCKDRRNKTCKVAAVTRGSHVERVESQHDHPANSDAEIIFKSALSEVTQLGKNSKKQSAQSICNIALSKVLNENDLDPTNPIVSKAALIIKGNYQTPSLFQG